MRSHAGPCAQASVTYQTLFRYYRHLAGMTVSLPHPLFFLLSLLVWPLPLPVTGLACASVPTRRHLS